MAGELDPLALVRETIAPLLHPESLWSYLWRDEDTQRISDVLDDAFGYPLGSGLWPLDGLARGTALFTFGEDHDVNCNVRDKAWILSVRPNGAKSRQHAATLALWVSPQAPSRHYGSASRCVTLKAWREASNKARERWFARRSAIEGLLIDYLYPDRLASRIPFFEPSAQGVSYG